MLKKLTILAALSIGSLVFADVNIRTNIKDVFVGGTCEQAGAVTFTVDNDDFADASTSNPVYIRMTLDHGAVLCKTLVDYENPDPDNRHINDPIYLPMRLEGGLSTDAIGADERTASIVRWIDGESQIWIRVQSSSSNWIDSLGGAIAPDPTRPVSFNLGVSARVSDDANISMAEGADFNANLPYHVRESVLDDSVGPDPEEAISTLLCVDLTGSNLQPVPAVEQESILNFDPISFQFSENVTTAPSAGGIDPGPQQQINFSNDTRIARGNPIDDCTFAAIKFALVANGQYNVGDTLEAISVPLCPGEAAGDTDQDEGSVLGLICDSNTYAVRINCPRGFNRGSYLQLTVPDETNYGFRYGAFDDDGDVIADSNGVALLSTAAFNIDYATVNSFGNVYGLLDDDSIDAGGTLLSRIAEITFVAAEGHDGAMEIQFQTEVCMWYEEGPTDVVIGVGAGITDRDSEYIANPAPYDGLEQEDFCDQGITVLDPLTWNWGSYVECGATAAAVRIFFPYVPKLAGTEFVAGVSFVNQGQNDLTSVISHIYESDGEGWVADFGPLPTRNLQTWLLVEDEQGVGFYNFDDLEDVKFIPVNPMEDTTKALFGTLRSSMYIVGFAEIEGSQTAGVSDLDGYMLIANGNDLSGAYTPRNMEATTADLQTADLPVLANKAALKPAVKAGKMTGNRSAYLLRR